MEYLETDDASIGICKDSCAHLLLNTPTAKQHPLRKAVVAERHFYFPGTDQYHSRFLIAGTDRAVALWYKAGSEMEFDYTCTSRVGFYSDPTNDRLYLEHLADGTIHKVEPSTPPKTVVFAAYQP